MHNANARKNLDGARTQNTNNKHNNSKRQGTKFILEATRMARKGQPCATL
jgi:hypothetical protein